MQPVSATNWLRRASAHKRCRSEHSERKSVSALFTCQARGGPNDVYRDETWSTYAVLAEAMASVRVGGEDGFGIVSATRYAHRAGRHEPSPTTGHVRSVRDT